MDDSPACLFSLAAYLGSQQPRHDREWVFYLQIRFAGKVDMVEDFEEKPMERWDLEQYCALIRRRRWHILIPLFLGWLVVCGASWVLPSVYKSGTLILVEQPIMPKDYVVPTSVWMRLTDGILLVTREGTTEKRLLQRGLEVLDPSKLVGAVVNSSKNTDDTRYYTYYQGCRPTTVKPQWDVRQWCNWSQLIKFSSLFSSFVCLVPKPARIRFGEDVAFRILRSIRRVMEKCHAKPSEIER
jgi:hypothetical protein